MLFIFLVVNPWNYMIEKIRQRVIRHNREDLTYNVEYIDFIIKTQLLQLIPKDSSILQIGCACGYGIETFQANGYKNLTAIDKDPEMGKDFPSGVNFVCDTIRNALPKLPAQDVIFSHRFLYILPSEEKSDELFNLIASKVSKYLVTIEAETGGPGWREGRHGWWRRNYKDVFEKLGFVQVWEDNKGLADTVVRIFKKNGRNN